ncbi:DNA-formamidopyrimidine glycosylase [Heliorestis convoluta]|uniref:Formamidopyrimidine-DNA glycosylase n=1 Tax=Heliorestis convoluta TaxID=356322 RepID=A0A5Q2N565_9FIRM|nr:DNA-formamidopyrimidine glycosylase [Heliorestis convoluta]QGG49083.1 formamidopyrimidine-DNA glycosylase [Heliorestis convoluta]
MPELPEVETVRRTLEKKVVGHKIEGVTIKLAKMVSSLPGEDFAETLLGRTIEAIKRRGKYLIFQLSGDYSLVIHLRMTGRLVASPKEEPLLPHCHVIFQLSQEVELRYSDVRQFGTLTLRPSNQLTDLSGLMSLGPEPLSEDFTVQIFLKALSQKKSKLKPLLLNQHFLAGLGNIYVDEALARAGLHPDRLAQSLQEEEGQKLYQSIQEVLREGIEARGTSFRDYVDGEGQKGDFQNQLWVYGREGEACRRCHEKIIREKRAGRSTHFCPCCQQ